jgi:hypothetical protein
LVKLDLGCGPNKKEGFIGVDVIAFPNVDHIVRLGSEPLPFEADTVDEVHASHFLEHLTARERCYLLNDLYRVMKVDAKATIIIPCWSSSRAYGDPTHQWPPIGEFFFYYLKKEWRDANAPHTDAKNIDWGYSCNFEATWGYGLHPMVSLRHPEAQQFAVNFYKEAVQDIHATLIKK